MGNKHDFPKIRQDTIQRRDNQLLKFLPQFDRIIKDVKFTADQIQQITRMDIVRVVQALNTRKITSQQLVAILGQRAATIGKNLCIITQDYFTFALKKAVEYDQYRAKSGKRNWTFEDEWNMDKYLPPLYGVPISFKDNIELEGTTSTVGLTVRANDIKKQDNLLAQAIKASGMIPFVKTNLPQIALNFDSNNFLWGRTLNPWNNKKSVGGSSGGEAAALAARVSLIGIGNDIGGSLRIPAAFCGVTSLMPGPGRIPKIGFCTKYSSGFSGMDLIPVATGPMSTSVDGLVLWMKSLTQQQFYGKNYDPYTKLQSFDIKLYKQTSTAKKKFKIGYFQNLELIECTSGSRRGVSQVVSFLKKEGHQVVEISIPNQREVIFSFFRELAGEGGLQSFVEMLEGEQMNEEYNNFKTVTNLNCCLFGCVKGMVGLNQPRMAMVIGASGNLTTHQYLENSGRVYDLRAEWIKYWKRQNLDFVICAGFGSEATNHGMSNDGSLLAAYTFIWNVLAMTSASLPVTVVRQDEQTYQSHWQDDITKAIVKSVADSAGLPVNVQVVGLPFEQERVLGLAKQIESHFRFLQMHPLPKV